MNPDVLFSAGLVLFLAGFLLAIAAVILLAVRSFRGGGVRGGGVILLGPVPIVFGDERLTKVLVFVAVIIFVVFLIVSIIPLVVSTA